MEAVSAVLRSYAIVAWRNRWYAVGLSWLVCLGGWAYVSLMPSLYEANARLYVDADAVLTPLLRGLALDDTPLNQVDVLQRTLLSRPNLEKLISKTGLDQDSAGPADHEKLVNKLPLVIHVTPQTKNLFTITYRDTSPKRAYDVVQAILAIFIETSVGSNRSGMDNAEQFLRQQLASYEQQLRQAEARRAEFRARYVDLLPSEAAGGASRLETARAKITALEGALADLTRKRDLLKREMETTPPALDSDGRGGLPVPGSLRGGNPELARAELALAELRLRYTDQHPEVTAARQRVEQLRASGLGAAPAPGAEARSHGPVLSNPVYEHLKLELLDNEASIDSLKRQVADAIQDRDRLEAMARSAPGVQAELVNLNRDYEVLYRNYTELLNRREAMHLSAAADVGAEKVRLQIIDPPLVPENPVAPKRALLFSAVLGMGLAAGGGFALLLQNFDRSFHSVDALHVLGLPVAGGISLILRQPVPLRRRLAVAASFAAALLMLGAAYGGLMLGLLRPA